MFYSHVYDLFAKLLILAILVASLFILQVDKWQSLMITQWGLREGQIIFFISLAVGLFAIPLFLFLYLPFLSPAAAWCYLRFSLKTPVSWAIAKKTESMFRPTLKRLEWLPLTNLKKLPEEEREATLLAVFEDFQLNQDQYRHKHIVDDYLRHNLSKNGYIAFQILVGLLFLWVGYDTLDHHGVPNWLNLLQAKYLFGGSYYPALSFVFALLLGWFLLAGLFVLISRIVKSKEDKL